MGTRESSDGTIFLRFIAIILVINSHMDVLYPIPWLGTGGAIGNSLFFMLSAYGLLLSEKKNKQTFIDYYVKRIRRIYPAVWINITLFIAPLVLLCSVISPSFSTSLIGDLNLNDPFKIAGMIFYPPTAYWFLQALMLYYLLGFFIIKNFNLKTLFATFISLSIIYVGLYAQFSDFSILVVESTQGFKMVFYAMVFLSGIYFASIRDRIAYNGLKDFVMLFVLLFAIYLHKLLMYKGISGEFQFLEQLLIFPLLYYFLKISKSEHIVAGLMKFPFIAKFITIVGAMTLELYIVHGPLRELAVQFLPGFPANVIIYALFTLLLSYTYYLCNQYITQQMSKKIP